MDSHKHAGTSEFVYPISSANAIVTRTYLQAVSCPETWIKYLVRVVRQEEEPHLSKDRGFTSGRPSLSRDSATE